jgi:hypothetical protein
MTRLLLDYELAKRLLDSEEPLEFCDPAGTVVGTFFPKAHAALYRSVVVPFTDAELDDAENELGGRPLADILADLEKS